MLLNAVVIILREVLEASLIISVFLALSRLLDRRPWWMVFGLIAGCGGAYFYASLLSLVTASMGGIGQEVVNASLHGLIYLCLLVFVIAAPHSDSPAWGSLTLLVVVIAVITAVTREGAEIILYISGFSGMPELLSPVLLGSAVGAGIGVSVGIFFYYLLVNMRPVHGIWLGSFVLLLVGGSMLGQSAEFLTQADLIAASAPIWDTSDWISERSVTGQLLYAMLGYEATPTAAEACAYFGGMGLMLLCALISYHFSTRRTAP